MGKNKLAKNIKKMIEQEVKNNTDRFIRDFSLISIRLLMSASIIVLNKHFGFGKKRANLFKKEVSDLCLKVKNSQVSIDELVEQSIKILGEQE